MTSDNETLAARLEEAAKIVRGNLPWQYHSKVDCAWSDAINMNPVAVLGSGYDIRIKPDEPASVDASDDECRRQFEATIYDQMNLTRSMDGDGADYAYVATERVWLAFKKGWQARGKESA